MPEAIATPLSYALQYARLGWHVLPLEPKAKQPLGRLVPRGMHDATTDEATIHRWWTQSPQAGIGIALAQSGLVAVDVDPRNGGDATFDQLQAAHGSLRSDVMAFTGGGGEHHVFLVPPGHQISLPGTLGPGVDLKANGYIVVEPSVHPSGRTYGWEASSSPLDGVVPSPLPDWLRSLRVELQRPAQRPDDVPVDPVQAREVREAIFLLDADDYDQWVKAGMALHSTKWGHPAYAIWCAWAGQSSKFDSTDSRRKWESFATDAERGAMGLTVAWIFAEAQRRGWKNPRAAEAQVAAVGQAAPTQEPAVRMLNLAELEAASAAVTWTVKGILPADSVGVMFGAPGTFKSFIALDMALHVAHGMDWMGKRTKKGAVIYIAAEGGTGLWKRIKAWHQARGLSWAGIQFYVVASAVMLSSRASEVTKAAESVGVTPALVIVDTKSQTDEGEENSSTDTAHYFREIGAWLRATWRASVVVVHHSGHSATERPRGSSAILGNVDFMFGVFRDEKEMLATVECMRQKDGELFESVSFSMGVETVGQDADGEPVRSLVAKVVNNAAELVEAVSRSGRGGNNALLMKLAQNGMPEKELRTVFYSELGAKDPDAKRQAWYRSLRWAVQSRLIEVAQGTVIVLQPLKD